MFSKKIEEVGNPIIYIFLTLGISSIYYGLNSDFKELSIFIVGFFFICLFYYCGMNFGTVMILFFIVGILVNTSYYKIPKSINGEIRIEKIRYSNIMVNYKGKNLMLKTTADNLKVGEKYIVSGTVSDTKDFEKGIVGGLSPIKMQKIKGDFITKLMNLREKIYKMLEENLGERKAGLVSSIAFGYSEYLDEEDNEEMKNLGIIHSISVSGLHVVIIYGFLKKLVGNKFGILATIIYVIFTGYNYPSIRALVMLISVEGGNIFKRNNNSLSALCLSAIILILFKPYSIFEISFVLSYLATLGIVIFNQKINYSLYKLPKRLREDLSITLSSQIFTMPCLILVFKDFSMNFILGNLLLVPLIDIIVITGNVLILTYSFKPIFDFISYINLIIIKIFDFSLDKIDSFTLPMFYGNEYVVNFYLFIIISFYFIRMGHKKFVYLPFISILLLAIQIYSPMLSIKYYKEGAILVAYRGDRMLLSNKNSVDLERLSKIALSNKIYNKVKAVEVSNICNIKESGKDFILDTYNEKYILKINGDKSKTEEYDIINFKNGSFSRIIIFKGNVVLMYT